MRAYLALAAVLLLVGSTGLAYHRGVQAGRDAAELEARRSLAQVAKTHRAIAKDSVEQQERIRVVYRTIRQDVVRYVQTHSATECFDAQGVALINRAAKGDAP